MMKYKKELHPLLETLGLIYLTKDFSAAREELIHSLEDILQKESFLAGKLCP